MGKFEETFSSAIQFSNDTLVVDGSLSVKEAVALFNEFLEEIAEPLPTEDIERNMTKDWVAFGYGNDAYSGEVISQWWLGSKGRHGAKEVWVFGG